MDQLVKAASSFPILTTSVLGVAVIFFVVLCNRRRAVSREHSSHTASAATERTSQLGSSDFDQAVERLKTSKKPLGDSQKLELYALFKQANTGQCTAPRPGITDFVGRAKWDAWSKLGALSREDARRMYAEKVNSLVAPDPLSTKPYDPEEGRTSLRTFCNARLEQYGSAAVLTVDRPKALNALNTATLEDIEAALGALGADTRVLIITGGGSKAFVAGADIAEMASGTAESVRAFGNTGRRVVDAIAALPFPTIAAVNGYALGGGLELAMACDLIYVAETARLGLPEVSLGVIPGFGGTQRLSRLVGRSRAKEMVFTGEHIDAAKAKEIGIALDIVPSDRLLPHCRAVAEKILRNGPLAVAAAKRVIDGGAEQNLASGCEMEGRAFEELFGTEDQKEGMLAFVEKRSVTFKGK